MVKFFAKALGLSSRKIHSSLKESRSLSVRTIHTQGSGLYGVLGHGPDLRDSEEFRLVNPPVDEELGVAARQVSAGWGHSAAVTRDGELAIWGRPFDFDNLMKLNQINGFSGMIARMSSRFTSKVGNAVDGLHTSPYIVEGFEDISSVHCSAGLTVALTNSGDMYSFGQNRWGQCGAGGTGRQTIYDCQEIDLDVKVKAVDTGLQHCIALSKYGSDVFTWGKATRGQLGVLDYEQEFFSAPQYVRGIVGFVTGVSAGFNHSAAVTAEGTVYLWGKEMSDIVKTTDRRAKYSTVYEDQMTPRALDIPGGRRAVEITSSNYTLLVRCDDDSLWALGSGEYDRAMIMTLMRVQQASDQPPVDNLTTLDGSDKYLTPPVLWPTNARLKKGFTRAAILSPTSAGLSTSEGSRDDNTTTNFIFEVILDRGEAYLVAKEIAFSAVEGETLESRTIIDYSSGWTHNILLLDGGQDPSS